MIDFKKIEKKWQKKWEEKGIFEANPRKKKKFFLTVPYPYTSGALHIGHGRTNTTGDVIARYKRMQGYNVLWPMGFHMTGTPIIAISDRISAGEEGYTKLFEHYISLYEKNENKIKEILNSFKEPFNVAEFFAENISKDFKSLGFSIDWRRQFNTGELIYNKFVEWQYIKLNKKGVISKGEYPITFCLLHKNAEGEDDIKDGDTNPVDVQEYTIVKFKLKDIILPAATLRPETIFGVTNIFLNPSITYVKTKVKNEFWLISKESFEKLSYQKKDIKKIMEINGLELIGKKVKTPIGKEVMVLPADFVDPDSGTGIVYSVPAHAPYDYIALEDLKKKEEMQKLNVKEINYIQIINIEGYKDFPAKTACEKYGVKNQLNKDALEEATHEVYKDEFYHGVLNEKCGKFSGLKISEIKTKVKDWLIEENLADVFYETSRKAECRAGGKIIVAVLPDQWFIDYSKQWWKKISKEHVKKILFIPEKYRKFMLDTIDWLKQRPCVRKRGIGTRFPFNKEWIIESLSDSTIYMAFYTIVHLIRKYKIKPEQLIPEIFDYIFLNKGNLNSLVKKSKISLKAIKQMKTEFEYWYPNNQRHTAPMHLSNHLTFFIMHHTAIFPKKYWPCGISLNEPLVREGVKMSKSKGNVIPLADISKKYSADLFRLYITSAASYETVMDWREKEINSAKKKMESFVDILSKVIKNKEKSNITKIDKWLISQFYLKCIKAMTYASKLRFRDYSITIFFDFLNDIEYYKRRQTNEISFYSTVKKILPEWLLLLQPIIPHICEEFWEKLGNKSFISLEELPKINKKLINKEIEISEELVKSTVGDIKDILNMINKKPNKIIIFISHDWKYGLIKKFIKIFKGKPEFKKIIGNLLKDEELKKYSKDVVNITQKLIKDPSKIPLKVLTKKKEFDALNEAKGFIEREFNCKVEIIDAERSKEAKANQTLPMKPGILIK